MKRLFFLSLIKIGGMRKSLFLFLLVLFNTNIFASSSLYFKYDENSESIYENIIQLKLNKAKHLLKIAELNDPNNLVNTHLASYIDFFTLFINEDQGVYNNLRSNRDNYLDRLSEGPSSDPNFRFCQAEVLLQWALIDLKFDNKFKGGKAIYDAYLLLEENQALFPDFINNNKSLSVIHVLAESVPSWVRTILGIKGSISLGKKEIQVLKSYALSHKDYMFREEVAAINSYILFYQINEKEKAIKDLDAFQLDHKTSPLLAFLKASMALRSGENEKCLTFLNETPSGKEYAKFHYLDFMKGRSLLYKLDPMANKYMKSYVNNFKGKHFIKEAYQKLAWYALTIENDPKQYNYYMKMCLSEGESLLDEDKQAYKEAQNNQIPDPILLKARVLFDGGYFHQAYQTLIINESQIKKDQPSKLEFYYRLGRTLQSLKSYSDALLYFSKVIDQGRSSTLYFACSSSLQMAMIYEELKDYNASKMYFDLALKMDPEEYKTTLHQKAKSGLERVSSK